LDGHGSHATLEAIEQAKEFRLDMIILPSHTFHALQPLNVAYFKPFKIAFRKERSITMVKRNYIKPNKITLARCVNKALDQTLTRKNIMLRFKGIGIWPLNPKPVDAKISPSIIYTLQNQAREEKESKQEDGEKEWTKHTIAEEFINIGSITEVTIVGLLEYQPKYYVNMFKIPTFTNHAFENMMENLEQPSLGEAT
jgi:hypothetical protein